MAELPLAEDLEMVVAPTESLGGQEEDLAEPAVSLTDQPPPVIDRTALMPPGEQPGTTGDHPCRGVVDDRPQFTGQFRGQHHVDSSQCQESHVGGLDQERHQFSFTRMNILLFRNAIPVQLSQEALMEDGLSVGQGSILGPGQDANQGGLLDSHALAARQFDEPGEPRLEDGLGSPVGIGNHQRDARLENIIKTSRISGEAGFEVFQDLAAELSGFLDQIPPVSGPELDLAVDWFPGGIDQPVAITGGLDDSFQVRIVGLLAGMSSVTEVAGDHGMHNPHVMTSGCESPLSQLVITPGLLQDHDVILDLVGSRDLADLGEGMIERVAAMVQDRGSDQNLAIEVGQHPLGAGLGTIDGDDAEVLGADGSDAG